MKVVDKPYGVVVQDKAKEHPEKKILIVEAQDKQAAVEKAKSSAKAIGYEIFCRPDDGEPIVYPALERSPNVKPEPLPEPSLPEVKDKT